jgi:predicted metalloprotease
MRESENVESRSGMRGIGMVGGGLGGVGLLAVVVISLLLGQNPLEIIGMLQGDGPVQTEPAPGPGGTGATGPKDPNQEFAARVLGDLEDTWTQIFRQRGQEYRPPRLVLFREQVQSACGIAGAASGPFYCPGDLQVYLDLAFFQDLRKLGAPGEFARAYVIAHEVGHHVQRLTGQSERVAQEQSRDRARRNALSVRLELQADCYAGVWGHRAKQRGLLEPGDVESGLGAAAAIGDDRLQKMGQGRVAPESFTHGSSAQRVRWFRTGLESGDPAQCDTFAGSVS